MEYQEAMFHFTSTKLSQTFIDEIHEHYINSREKLYRVGLTLQKVEE